MPAGYPRTWNPEEDEQLIAGYHRGDTLTQLAAAAGCELFHITARLGVLRVGGYDLPPRKPRWTTERRRELAKRRRSGASLRDLEVEFEVTRGSITSQLRTLRRLGYDLGPDGHGTLTPCVPVLERVPRINQREMNASGC